MISFFLSLHYVTVETLSWSDFEMKTMSLSPSPKSSVVGWWLRGGKTGDSCLLAFLGICLDWDGISGLTLAVFIYTWHVVSW